MPDYKAMYFELFNKISDAIELLQEAQQETEEQYISDETESGRLIIAPAIETEEE
ncbi:MAG: hypothetical protein LBN00_00090 [Oscillospiraceae bacterium]|jgi:hypothetical protein|nr:hypothetical protein [Oscillospiraceae bacterium]